MKKKIKLDDVDVLFDPTPITPEEKRKISDFIRLDKAKRMGRIEGNQHQVIKRNLKK